MWTPGPHLRRREAPPRGPKPQTDLIPQLPVKAIAASRDHADRRTSSILLLVKRRLPGKLEVLLSAWSRDAAESDGAQQSRSPAVVGSCLSAAMAPEEGLPDVSDVVRASTLVSKPWILGDTPDDLRRLRERVEAALAAGATPREALLEAAVAVCSRPPSIRRPPEVRAHASAFPSLATEVATLIRAIHVRDLQALARSPSRRLTKLFPSLPVLLGGCLISAAHLNELEEFLEWVSTEVPRLESLSKWEHALSESRKRKTRCADTFRRDKSTALKEMTRPVVPRPMVPLQNVIRQVRDKGRVTELSLLSLASLAGHDGPPDLFMEVEGMSWTTSKVLHGLDYSMKPTPPPHRYRGSLLSNGLSLPH